MTSQTVTREALNIHAKPLASWLKRWDRWMRMVNGEIEWNVRAMPSKNSKHRAYAYGSQLARMLNLPHPRAVEDLRAVLAAAQQH